MSKLLQKLYSEHRSIAAVLHGMRYLVQVQKEQGKHVDTKVFRAMLYYLDVFPEREHHRKEEQYLFAALRQRDPSVEAVLSQLTEDHHEGENSIRALEQALVRYEAGGDAEFPAFASAVERFVAGYFEHMRREESDVMPVAERILSTDEWRAVEAAFAEHEDPLQGVNEGDDYRELFSRIVSLAPAPIGLGAPL